jgi:hypothetical protein
LGWIRDKDTRIVLGTNTEEDEDGERKKDGMRWWTGWMDRG